MAGSSVFVGDDLSAAGFRLCGMDTRVPAPGQEAQCLRMALEDARVVLLGCRCANAIPAPALDAALTLLTPLVVVVPDWDGSASAVEPASKVRHALGLDE